MNAGSIQSLLGSAQQLGSQVGNAKSGNMFGSVFSSVLASGPTIVAPVEESPEDAMAEETLATIFKATTIEEIAEALSADKGAQSELVDKKPVDGILELDSGENRLVEFFNLPDMEQLAGLLNMDVEQFIDSIIPLLEKAGLSESELTAAIYTNDFWPLLDTIDKVAPQFFAEMANALEGKGMIPKEQAIELLALLKSVTIAAPKTDLLMKQEQQVFSLQGFILAISERVESVIAANQNRTGMLQFMESNQIVRMAPPADANQNRTGILQFMEPNQAVRMVPQAQNAPNDESLKDSPKETVQSVMNQLSTMRSEASITEIENRNNSRNEALMREMQNIFKRSNFGQAGGTNRLLIKLYPEHLGQVRIELLQVNGVMTARILASSALGKEMLSSQLDQLKAAFVQQNLQVERVDVSQTLQDASRNERDNAFNQHFKKEQEDPNDEQDQTSEEDMTFQEYMIELEA